MFIKRSSLLILYTPNIVCPRCGNKNSPASKFCNSCGLCLDVKTAMRIDELRAKADRLMSELIKNPKVLDVLLEAIEKT